MNAGAPAGPEAPPNDYFFPGLSAASFDVVEKLLFFFFFKSEDIVDGFDVHLIFSVKEAVAYL